MNLSLTKFVRLPLCQLMDAALASFLPTRVSPSSVESWHPNNSLYGSLLANIRPSVFYIQMFVNPSFDAALPFTALSFEERISVHRAVHDVLAFLVRGSSARQPLVVYAWTGHALGTALSRNQIAGLSRRCSMCQGLQPLSDHVPHALLVREGVRSPGSNI
jgi:hypothetical protein